MEISQLLKQTKNLNWQERLKFVSSVFEDIVFSTSFSIEDQVIFDFIAQNKLPITVFTLDTGRLPKETYEVWQNSLDKYPLKITAYYPAEKELKEFISQEGINPFYKNLELRLKCCQIRKVEPLKRALKRKNLWISGVRKEHSSLRGQKDFFEKDEGFALIKFYPLLELSEKEVWEYIEKNRVPFNELYKKGYKSIGCEPCTRAVASDEDVRAGRWWWESDLKKECGLHKA